MMKKIIHMSDLHHGAGNKLRRGVDDLVVVPGNHDLGTGSKGEPNMVRLFEETFYGSAEGFPKLFCKGGIAFVVLNSLADELHDDDRRFAQGEIGSQNRYYSMTSIVTSASMSRKRQTKS